MNNIVDNEIKRLYKLSNEFYKKGVVDEDFVMEATMSGFGGNCYRSKKKEDIYDHIDFWWDSPKGGKIGIDVKGLRKNKRSDKNPDDTIQWLELKNVSGNKGWIYGKAKYIAFRLVDEIVYVLREKLVEYAEKVTKDKTPVYGINPNEFYVPYTRKNRKDVIVKVPTYDIKKIMHFALKL